MQNKKIIIVAGEGPSTNIVFNALNETFGVHSIIIEESETMKVFLKRRLKRLGLWTVIGQILFKVFVVKFLNATSKDRLAVIIESSGMNTNEIPDEKIIRVPSINASSSIDKILQIKPDLIIVNGTRIISKKVLEASNCKFINTHTGMTPMYRGVHGTYWALTNDDLEHSGVTVHYVDAGIDTGNIIEQGQVIPTAKDNFVTYPMIQLALGVEILLRSVKSYFDQTITVKQAKGGSKLYYHPTIWQYLYFRITKNVK